VQDAAYASLLKSRRQEIHRAIVCVMERDFPDAVSTQPEVIARHSELGGQMERAVQHWRSAAELAIARSATAEAATLFGRALACLEALPLTRDRRERELELLTKLGPALIHVKGYAAPEAGRIWTRARKLCSELDDLDRIGPILFGQYVFHFVRAEFEQARESARELLEFGRDREDSTAQLVGMRNLGVTCLSTGELANGRQYLETAVEGLGEFDQKSITLAYGQDLHATGLLWLAKLLFVQGFPEQAIAAAERALEVSEALGHPNTQAFSLCQAAKVFALARDERSLALVTTAVEFATEQGYEQWQAEALAIRGWVSAELGELESGLAELDRGASACRASGAVRWLGTHLGLRGRILTLLGRLDEAEEVLREALLHNERTGERWFDAELDRLLGEVLARCERNKDAEASFRRALDNARAQGARMWELRAAASLLRLQADGPDDATPHELLARIYAWFSEGLDTPDLREARTLLASRDLA
jgi:predicted ATPase